METAREVLGYMHYGTTDNGKFPKKLRHLRKLHWTKFICRGRSGDDLVSTPATPVEPLAVANAGLGKGLPHSPNLASITESSVVGAPQILP